MLSDAEQRRLTEIELALRADDPRFARRFDARAKRRYRRRWQAVVALILAFGAVVGVVTGLVLDSVATVVFAVTALGVAAGLWGSPRRGQSPTRDVYRLGNTAGLRLGIEKIVMSFTFFPLNASWYVGGSESRGKGFRMLVSSLFA